MFVRFIFILFTACILDLFKLTVTLFEDNRYGRLKVFFGTVKVRRPSWLL